MSFANWTGWTGVPPPNAPQPPPAGVDIEESAEDVRLTKGWTPPPRTRMSRTKEFIDRDLIERILGDDNGQELKWLQELLEDGVRVLNATGRYIKSEPFLAKIRKARKEQTNK